MAMEDLKCYTAKYEYDNYDDAGIYNASIYAASRDEAFKKALNGNNRYQKLISFSEAKH